MNRLCFLFLLALSLTAFTSGKADEPIVQLPPYRVEGNFSELSFRARFRYNIPFNALKTLVLTKASKSWLEHGLALGDEVVTLDGTPVDGLKFTALFKQLTKKPKEEALILEIRTKGSTQTRRYELVPRQGSNEITIHYP